MTSKSSRKKFGRRFFSRPFETVFFLILLLTALTIFFIPINNDIFPNNGGFVRNVFFIKPTTDADPPYFIFIDELHPTSDTIPIDWVLHGRGNLTVFNLNQSAIWTTHSYLDPDTIVSLHAIFIEPEVHISNLIGPFYPQQSYAEAPLFIPYIKARPVSSGNARIMTLLVPMNETHILPNITRDANAAITYIGSQDLIFSQKSSTMTSVNNFTTNAQILFMRLNNTELSSFILKSGTLLADGENVYLESNHHISVNLEYQSSNMTGMIWINSPINLSLWVPNTPKTTQFNGKDLEKVQYNPLTKILSFPLFENGSIYISYNPVKSNSNLSNLLSEDPSFPPTTKDLPLKNFGSHPYIFFNETTLSDLRARVLLHPWQQWFSRVETNAINHLSIDILSMDPESRFEPTLDLAFAAIINQNLTYLNKAKEFLLAIDPTTAYDLHLRRGRATSHYALAFDMLYQNLTITERTTIANLLGNHTLPLINIMPVVVRNNHVGVVASGIGLAGLALQNNAWIELAISGIDDYFTTCFTTEGGNFEGYSYAGYFLESGLRFFYGLMNTGGKNYFADQKFLNFINTTIYCQSPLTTVPIYEDSTSSPEIVEALLWSAAQIYPYAPLLGNYSQWVFEARLLNDALIYDGSYLSSSSPWTHGMVARICMYSMNITPVQPPLVPVIVWSESGLAIFRTGWQRDAIYFSMTCKSQDRFQFHAHYDEVSFELWAYGAWLVANPGYPGYGKGEYEWTVSTEASNTLLFNNKGQQRVNADGFQEYFQSSSLVGIVASATSLYASPGSLGINSHFLGLFIFILTTIILAFLISFFLRWRAYNTNISFIPEGEQPTILGIRQKNLTLKVHLSLLFGLVFGLIVSLASFFIFANIYINEYMVGRYTDIANLIPLIEIIIIMAVIPLVFVFLSLKFRLQGAIARRITCFSNNLQISQVPSLSDSIKISYFPQTFFLVIFIPLLIFLYTPLLKDLLNFIFTTAGSTLDIQNYVIQLTNTFLIYLGLTFLLYLPFKIIGIFLGARSLSEKTKTPISDAIFTSTASYLISLALFLILLSYLLYSFLYSINFLVLYIR